MENLKITNQEIINIVEKGDQTDSLKYDAVMMVEAKAEINTNNKVRKTKNYWTSKDWNTFAKEVKVLLN